MQKEIMKLKKYGKTIGFVPTMGYLHDGHIELLRKARAENDLVVLSIFVNPLQFGPNEDFNSYPRDIENDKKIAKTEKVDYLFFPEATNIISENKTIEINVTERTDVLCGKSRPGHFNGVATILTMLFLIIMPNRVYFGRKDAQQVAIVTSLIDDLHFPIKLVEVETVRETDGLAKSSRNVNLTEEERVKAPYIYDILQGAQKSLSNKQLDIDETRQFLIDNLTASTGGTVDYVEILSYPELKQLKSSLEGQVIIAVAVKFSKVRLIDNIIFTLD